MVNRTNIRITTMSRSPNNYFHSLASRSGSLPRTVRNVPPMKTELLRWALTSLLLTGCEAEHWKTGLIVVAAVIIVLAACTCIGQL